MLYLNSVRVAPGVRSALAVACGLVLASVAQTVWAAEDEVGPVVVTATRTPTRVNKLVADVTVIDRAQIEQATGQTVAELLSYQPGMQVSSNGGTGQLSSVFIRGASSGQSLLLVDGVPYNSGTSGTPSLDNIPLEEIDHIEIVRGPLAALYGSSAASGVIQIFTRKGQAGFAPFGEVTLGSDRFYSAGAGFRGGDDRVSYSVHASSSGESGFSASNSNASKYTFNPDRDGFTRSSVTAKLGAKLTDAWRVDGSLASSKSVVHYDDGIANPGPSKDTNSDQATTVASLAVTGQLNPDWRTIFRVAHTDDSTDTKVANSDSMKGAFVTRQLMLGWENQIKTPIGQALLAFEQLSQDAGDTSIYDYMSGTFIGLPVTSRTIRSVIAGLSGSQGAHDWQVSARQDRNSQFGDEVTGALGYGLRVTPEWKIAASLGSSFIAPSFDDLYYPDYGNPDLKPQHGVNKDVSLTWAQESHDVRLTHYDNRIRDYVQSTEVEPFVYRAMNVNGVRLSGWTLSGTASQDVSIGRLYANGKLDWLDAHDVDTDAKLTRQAAKSAAFRVGLTSGVMSYELSAKANAGAPDGTTHHLAGYTIWGASVRWAVARDWAMALRADNIGNHAYQTVWGYNQPLNRYFLTLSYTPNTK
ncbi:MAG: TonB-dependent receptor [Aquabacterium sp.]